MATSPDAELKARLDALTHEVAELRRRVGALERMVGTESEHPNDRTVVQSKVTYDWQG